MLYLSEGLPNGAGSTASFLKQKQSGDAQSCSAFSGAIRCLSFRGKHKYRKVIRRVPSRNDQLCSALFVHKLFAPRNKNGRWRDRGITDRKHLCIQYRMRRSALKSKIIKSKESAQIRGLRYRESQVAYPVEKCGASMLSMGFYRRVASRNDASHSEFLHY